MTGFQFILFSFWAFFAGVGLLLVIPARYKSLLHFLIVLLVGAATSIPAIQALNGHVFKELLNSQPLFGNISIELDSLSAWFILIINFTSLMGAIYGTGYMKAYKGQTRNLTVHWISFLVFQSSMIWVTLVQNMLVFLIVWELMSLSSLLLVIFDHNNNHTLKAGLNYLIQMHIGVALLTAAFIWVYTKEGSMDFLAFKSYFEHHSNKWIFMVLFAGFGIKAGFIPLHSWLPHAHPAAPSHVSGVMSGVIVKMGIYGILRMLTFIQSDFVFIGKTILIVSLLTGLYGIINSAMHRDFKRMLAYSTIENIGIIGTGIGLGMIGIGTEQNLLIIFGFSSALLHILNHSLFKSMLFFTAGSVYQQTHTRDMEKLGGLIKKMPYTAVLFLIGALAIGGLPPFNGFISEFLLYSGLISGVTNMGIQQNILMIVSISVISLIGGISVFAFTRSFGVIFLGVPRSPLKHTPVEVPFLMRLPQYIIVITMMLVAFIPTIFIEPTMKIITHTFHPIELSAPIITGNIKLMAHIGLYSLLFLILIGVMLCIRYFLANQKPTEFAATWGCGYIVPKPNHQYTGKSFSKTLGKLLSFMVIEKKKYHEIDRNDIFPAHQTHSSHYADYFELRWFDRLTNLLLGFMNRFQFIQNGLLQRYILYGLFFILVIFICSVFNFI